MCTCTILSLRRSRLSEENELRTLELCHSGASDVVAVSYIEVIRAKKPLLCLVPVSPSESVLKTVRPDMGFYITAPLTENESCPGV